MVLLLVAGLGVLWPAGGGYAQDRGQANAGREPAGYKAAIDSAIEEFDRNNMVEARELFGRAHALFPNARTLRGLGITEFELRNYVDSVSLLEQALEADVKRLEGPLRTDTETLLARARGYVGEVRLRVSPATVTVSVDGVAADVGPLGSLVLGVGDHILEFRAEGRLTERRAIKVKGQQIQTLQLALTEPVQAATVAQGPVTGRDAPPAASERTPVYKRWWLWTTVGVVLVGAGVATALLMTAEKTYEPVTTVNTPRGVSLQPSRGP